MKYHIPSGTPCSIAKDDEQRAYRAFVTRKPLTFDSLRSNESGAYTFELDGWILLIRADSVQVVDLAGWFKIAVAALGTTSQEDFDKVPQHITDRVHDLLDACDEILREGI